MAANRIHLGESCISATGRESPNSSSRAWQNQNGRARFTRSRGHEPGRRERPRPAAGGPSSREPRHRNRDLRLPVSVGAADSANFALWVGDAKPVRERKLYFSEKPSDPKASRTAQPFLCLPSRGRSRFPTILTPRFQTLPCSRGTWRTGSSRTGLRSCTHFHIHQIHFLLKEWITACRWMSLPAGYRECSLLEWTRFRLSQRQLTADGFQEPSCGGDLRLPLPSAGARRRRNDGDNSRWGQGANQASAIIRREARDIGKAFPWRRASQAVLSGPCT